MGVQVVARRRAFCQSDTGFCLYRGEPIIGDPVVLFRKQGAVPTYTEGSHALVWIEGVTGEELV